MAGGVAQGEGLEFKPLSPTPRKKKKKKKKVSCTVVWNLWMPWGVTAVVSSVV
jgi:hypothetical protein